MYNQPKSVGQKPGCPKQKGPLQYKKPDTDPFLHYSTSPNEPHKSTLTQTASINNTSQLSTASCAHPTASVNILTGYHRTYQLHEHSALSTMIVLQSYKL